MLTQQNVVCCRHARPILPPLGKQTTVRTELLAGLTTFLTMAYIIFVQPAVLSGQAARRSRPGMDFGAVTTATCLAAALATVIMGLYARYPIAQAPGMGENFFFVLSAAPGGRGDDRPQVAAGAIAAGATTPWQIAPGRGLHLRRAVPAALAVRASARPCSTPISPSMRNGIAVGIGLFIAFIGLQNAGLILADPGTTGDAQPQLRLARPDRVLLRPAGDGRALHARRVRGAILWGIVAATLLAVGAAATGCRTLPGGRRNRRLVTDSMLMKQFAVAERRASPAAAVAGAHAAARWTCVGAAVAGR